MLAAPDPLRGELREDREPLRLRGRQPQRDPDPVLARILGDHGPELEPHAIAFDPRDVARRPAGRSDLILDVDDDLARRGRRELELDMLAQLVELRGPRAAGAANAIRGRIERAMRLLRLAPCGGQPIAKGELALAPDLDQAPTRREDRSERGRRLVGRIGLDQGGGPDDLEHRVEPLDRRLGLCDPPAGRDQLCRLFGGRELRGRGIHADAHGRRDRRSTDLDPHGVVDHGERQPDDPHAIRQRRRDRHDPSHARAARIDGHLLDARIDRDRLRHRGEGRLGR